MHRIDADWPGKRLSGDELPRRFALAEYRQLQRVVVLVLRQYPTLPGVPGHGVLLIAVDARSCRCCCRVHRCDIGYFQAQAVGDMQFLTRLYLLVFFPKSSVYPLVGGCGRGIAVARKLTRPPVVGGIAGPG